MHPTLADWGLLPTDWVSPCEAAAFLDVPLEVLTRARRRRTGPTHEVRGRMVVRYLAASLPEWQGRLAFRKGIPTPEAQKVSEVG